MPKNVTRYLIWLAVFSAVNYLSAEAAIIFGFMPEEITMLWPPTGISLGILWRYGLRWWPGVLIGNFLIHYSLPMPYVVGTSFTTALGDTLEVVTAVSLLRLVNFEGKFEQLAEVWKFLIFGVFLPAFIGCTVGTMSRYYYGQIEIDKIFITWLTWYSGDAISLLLLSPLIMVFPLGKKLVRLARHDYPEKLLLLAVSLGLSFMVFTNFFGLVTNQLPLAYLTIPPLVWAALRFTQPITFLVATLSSSIGIAATANHIGPFSKEDVFTTLGLIWSFQLVTSIMAMVLVAIQSEVRLASKLVKSNEIRFKALSRAGFESLFFLEDGKITDCNEAAIQQFGFASEALKGKEIKDFFQFEQVPDFTLEQEITGVQAFRNGQAPFTAALKSRSFRYKGKKIAVLAVSDISILTNALYKEQELNEELAIREEELRQQLSYVEQVNQKLEVANKALDRFVYSVSHDLRAPISSVMGLINIARLEKDPKRILDYLDLKEKSLKKLDGFISDILDFSRNSRMDVSNGRVDIKELFEEVFEHFSYLDGTDSMVRTCVVTGEVPFFSDRRRLNVIFNNLISNSIRYRNPYSEQPYVRMEVEITQDQALIRLSDNGIGIRKEFIDKVFDMFFRANNHTVGSGLGLYIVKEVVDKLRGEIHVSSVVNQGTTFTIHIPNQYKPDSASHQI
jgi:signal transduction histidine kinase/integral membrane sensor domain MASE1